MENQFDKLGLNKIRTYVYNLYTKTMSTIPGIVFVYFGVVAVHYIASNVYPTLCSPWSIFGFIMTPFMVVTPHCEALRWSIHYTGDQIRNGWLWVGAYLVGYFGTNVTPILMRYTSNSNIQSQSNDTIEENIVDKSHSPTHNLRSRRSNHGNEDD